MVLPSSFRYPMRSIRDQQQQCNAERLFSDSLWTCSIGTRRRESQGTMLRYIAGTQAIVSLVLPACCRAPLRGASDLVACVACTATTLPPTHSDTKSCAPPRIRHEAQRGRARLRDNEVRTRYAQELRQSGMHWLISAPGRASVTITNSGAC